MHLVTLPSLVAQQPLWGPTLGATHFTLGQHQVALWWVALTTHNWVPSYLEATIFGALGDFLPPWRWFTMHWVSTRCLDVSPSSGTNMNPTQRGLSPNRHSKDVNVLIVVCSLRVSLAITIFNNLHKHKCPS